MILLALLLAANPINPERLKTLPKEAQKSLAQHQFAVVAGSERNFFSVYDKNAYEKVPSFVSVDVVLHVFHARFDQQLREAELSSAMKALKKFAALQLEKARNKGASGEALAVFHGTALGLLDEKALDGVPQRARQNIEQIQRATGRARLEPCSTDLELSLFKPRGHYAHASLQSYFRAFTFYALCGFSLEKDRARAIEVAKLIDAASQEALEPAQKLLDFVAGHAPDALSFESMRDEKLTPRTGTFRVLSTAETPDGELFRATAGKPERLMPSTLDLLTVLGSKNARALLRPSEELGKILDAPLRSSSGLFAAWLEVLLELLHKSSGSLPAFASSAAWRQHTLVSAAGSWAELRHDTLLYVKQPIVMRQGGHDVELPEAKVGGYIEPLPEVYRALLKLHDANAALGGMRPDDDLADFLNFAISTSQLELEGKPFPPEVEQRLRVVGGEIEHLSRAYGDATGPQALVVDVFTVVDEGLERIWHVGIGDADELWVIVPRLGKSVLTRGAVFSFYELTESRRLNDAEWISRLEENAPKRPDWAQVVGAAKKPKRKD